MTQRGFVGTELIVGALVIAVVFGYVAFLHVRLADCRAKLAQFEGAYKALGKQIQVQNEAVQDLEKKSAAAAARGAQARSQAAQATQVAQKSADALAVALAAPRVPSECPSALALVTVRDDLRSRPQTP